MRYYDKWAGNPKGNKEGLKNCVVSVADFSGWHHFQCSRKRGHGKDELFCKQHAKMANRNYQSLWIPEDVNET